MEALDITFVITDAQGFEIPDADKIAEHMDFWNRFEIQPNGCWEANLKPIANGYIIISVDGTRNTYAHREAFERYHNRKIQPKREIHHECRNRKCANPMHMSEMTRYEHMRADGIAKLTPEEAMDIYTRVWSGEMGRDLAIEYGIGQSQVSAIKNGKQWASVTRHAR